MERPVVADAARHAAYAGPEDPAFAASRVSIFTLFSDVLRRRGWVIGTTLVAFAVVTAVTLLRERTYTSDVRFVTQQRRGQSNLGGLAAQLGLAVPSGDAQGPQFYLDLLQSRTILGRAVDSTYAYTADTGAVRATLPQIYGSPGDTPGLRREEAIKRLARDVESTASPKTGVITVAVSAPHPVLAHQLANRLIALISDYNLSNRKSQATEERAFTGARLKEAGAELRAAEDRLANFLVGNRAFRTAPGLSVEFGRLERDLSLRQQTYSSLAQAFEQAKIEEVRDAPVISIVEPPEVPLRPDGRGTIRNALLALIGGALLGSLIALVGAHLERLRSVGARDFEEFTALRREAVRDLAHPGSSLARMLKPRGGEPRGYIARGE